jgi:hypothetical protein
MKKALEAAVVAAVLALGVFVARSVIARREAAERPPAGDPSLHAGPDAAPGAPYDPAPSRAAQRLPMLKLNRPPKADRRPAAVPPPTTTGH